MSYFEKHYRCNKKCYYRIISIILTLLLTLTTMPLNGNEINALEEPIPKINNITFYSMHDFRWSNLPMRGSDTLNNGGCVPTSVAMIASSFYLNPLIVQHYTPGSIFADPGYVWKAIDTEGGLYWDSTFGKFDYLYDRIAPKSFWITGANGPIVTSLRFRVVSGWDENDFKDILRRGKPVIMRLFLGLDSSGKPQYHEVVAVGWGKDSPLIYDPEWTQAEFLEIEAGDKWEERGSLSGIYGASWSGLVDHIGEPYLETSEYTLLSITAHSPLEMLIVNPDGKKSGFENETNIYEIQDSSYYPLNGQWGATSVTTNEDSAKYLSVFSPKDGKYRLTLVGTGNGPYSLDFEDGPISSNQSQNVEGTITTGEVQKYELQYSSSDPLAIAQVSNFSPEAKSGEDRKVALNAPIEFDGTSSFDLDGSIVSYSWDFGDGTIVEGEKVNHSFTNPGTYNVNLTVTDDKGSTGVDSVLVTVFGAPQTTCNVRAPNSSGWYNDDVMVHLEAVDNEGGFGVKEIHYRINGGEELVAADDNVYFSVTDTSIISFWSVDNAGNVEEAKSEISFWSLDNDGISQVVKGEKIFIDKTAPSISINSPTADTYQASDSITLQYSATDDLSGVDSVTAILDGVPVNNGDVIDLSNKGGDHLLTVSSTDKAGNQISSTVTFSVEITGAYSGWRYVGNAAFSADEAYHSSIAIDSNNTPYVAYYQKSASGVNYEYNVAVMKYNGESWESVGGPTISEDDASEACIVLDSNNTPYVAYNNHTAGKIAVMRFDGANWETVGNADTISGWVAENSIAIDSDNNPYIVFYDSDNGGKATVMKFNGTSWETVGNPAFTAGKSGFPAIAIDGNNTPYVIFEDYANGQKATVMRYNGSDWEIVGDAGFSEGYIAYHKIAIDGNNIPYVVYGDWSTGFKAVIKRYNGASWEPVGQALSEDGAYYTSIAIDSSSVPYVVYNDLAMGQKATVMRFNGTSWEALGGAGFTTGAVDEPSIAVDSNNVPYIVYGDVDNGWKATVMKYTSLESGPPQTTCSLSPTEPNSFGWYNQDVEVSLAATAGEGGASVKEIHYSINGGEEKIIAGASTGFTVDKTSTVSFWAVDNDGNVETAQSRTIDIDKTAPVITITSPTEKTYLATDAMTIEYDAIDDLSGIDNVTATLDGAPVSSGMPVDLSDMIGNHTLTVTAIDKAGNIGTSSVVSIVDGGIEEEKADIGITKSVDKSTVNVGDNVVYTIIATNNGPDEAKDVTVYDALPQNINYSSYSSTQGTYDNETGIWSLGTLANGVSATLQITATPSAEAAGTTVRNTALLDELSQTDSNADNDSAVVDIYVQSVDVNVPTVDVEVVKSLASGLPNSNNTVTFDIAVTNHGPDSATGVEVIDTFSPGLTYLSSVPAKDGTSVILSDQEIIWNVGSLAKDETKTLSVTAIVSSTGTITNTASLNKVDQQDIQASNNSSTEDISVGNLAMTKFYDANINGLNDLETELGNWMFEVEYDLDGSGNKYGWQTYGDIDSGTPVYFLTGTNVKVTEKSSEVGNWLPTTSTTQETIINSGTTELDFGNVCIGDGGGYTSGFWSNKNGQRYIGSDDLAVLSSLNLRDVDGNNFDPTNYATFKKWLLDAKAVNMSYRLSVQLAAMEMNVYNGFVQGTSLVYAPDLEIANAFGFVSVNDLMNYANELIYASTAKTLYVGSDSPDRSKFEAVKNALDNANNNKNFLNTTPCTNYEF